MTKKKAVLLGSPERKVKMDAIYNEAILSQLGTHVDLYPHLIGEENLLEHRDFIRDAEVAFSTWGMPQLMEEQIRTALPRLKAIFYAAGSVQRFARPFLNEGVIVCSAWAANAIPVSEYTVAQIILANKGVLQTMMLSKSNSREFRRLLPEYPGNFDVKVGLIGAGMIGRKVISLLKNYRLDVGVYDPFLTDEQASHLGVEKMGLLELFATCQTISNHLADVPETVGILNIEHFQRMLPNATFINTGRGKQVVEADLIQALKQVPTRMAILDVTDPEPVEPDSEFLTLNNVILTPHIAGSGGRELTRMAEYMLEELSRYLNGEPLQYEVKMEMLEHMA